MSNRIGDIRFLLDHLLTGAPAVPGVPQLSLDPDRIGIAGHSSGGWTALAAVEFEKRIRTVVALAPAGSSKPKPGVIPAKLSFAWNRDVPTLYLAAEEDVSLPLAGMCELFARTPATKRMAILRHADHLHFMDNAAQLHEAVRATPLPAELAWISKEMRPIAELCGEKQAHLFTRGLTLAHFDATLKQDEGAREFLAGDLAADLAARGVAAICPPSPAG